MSNLSRNDNEFRMGVKIITRTAGMTDMRETYIDRIGRIFEHPWFVPAVAALGLCLRIALLAITTRHPVVFQDELDYQAIAVSLWKTHQYAMFDGPTAFRAPGEPFFIAAIYAVLGYAPLFARLLQVILLTALPFLCAALGRRIGLGVRAANAGALLASLHPGLAYSATTIYPTALTAVALTAGLLYTSMAADNNSDAESVKGGLTLGFAGCLTTTFVPLPLFAALYCMWMRKMRAAVIVFILGMTPAIVWLIRNDRVFGEFTLATNGGLNLFLGANDQSTPSTGNRIWLPPNDPGIAGRDEIGLDRMSSRRAITWIRSHPGRYAALFVGRSILVLDSVGSPKTQGLHSGLGPKLIALALFPIILLGVVGLIVQRRRAAGFLTAAALLLVALSSAATIVKPRFRFPCDPALGVFAIAAVPRLRLILQGRRHLKTGDGDSREAAR